MAKLNKSNLYIIAGPNGAGKTTFAARFLPQYAGCNEFVNADLIAGGLSPFNQASADLAAGKLMLDRINLLAKRKADFAFETTLSGKSYGGLLEQLKKSGYHISLFFLWLPDVKLSLQRIAERVRRGGHNVPPDIVRRRFKRGIVNFFQVYRPLCDLWILFDNSTENPEVIAYEIESFLSILNSDLFSFIKEMAQ
jgi:predicted ABC-type ATPase